MKDPTDNEEVVFAQIGVLLLLVQDFEWLLQRCLKLVFADRADLTAEKIFAADKRTLGTMIKDLRVQAHIEQDIDGLLNDVLEDRNLFVHRLRHEPWFDTKTTAGRDSIFEFFARFQPKLQDAIMLFTAIAFRDAKEIGFDSPDFRKLRATEFWNEISTRYGRHAHRIRKKG